MILFYNNPYDDVSCNTRDLLFVNQLYPLCIDRLSSKDDGAFWVSYLPTVILCTDDGKTERARIEDFAKITVSNYEWLMAQDVTKAIDPSTAPDGVIVKT